MTKNFVVMQLRAINFKIHSAQHPMSGFMCMDRCLKSHKLLVSLQPFACPSDTSLFLSPILPFSLFNDSQKLWWLFITERTHEFITTYNVSLSTSYGIQEEELCMNAVAFYMKIYRNRMVRWRGCQCYDIHIEIRSIQFDSHHTL